MNDTASFLVINNDMDIRTCLYYPASSTPIVTMKHNRKGVINQNNSIIDFKLKSHHPIKETFPEALSASS